MKVKLINEQITSDYGKNLLRARGIEDVEKFLNPDESCLQTWEDLDNIKTGINEIAALSNESKVGLVVDCDVDGFTSATILYNYLHRYLPLLEFTFYIHEGKAHGLEEHWQKISDENFDLVIVPDAGSNDKQYAEQINCPILIIDHHLVEDENFSSNMIVINNQLSKKYRNKNLSGAGMAYQFCRGMDYYFENNWAKDYIDLAALGICADMMSGLEVENQYFWKEGFANVKNIFFMALALKQAYSITGQTVSSWGEIQANLDPTTVAFYIVPLINAMVRMGTLEEKERMLHAFISGHDLVPSGKRGAKGTMEEVAIESVRECTNARTHQNKFLDSATEILEQKIFKYDLLENKILFIRLDEEDFPSELNGLVAMRLSQKYKHPTIVARLGEDGYIKGSLRGLNDSDLVSFKEYLNSTNLFEYVQGHDNAAGISLLASNLSKLHNLANEELKNYDFNSNFYQVDFQRQALSKDLPLIIEDLEKYKHVWSQKNNQPLLYITDLHFSKKNIKIMGKKEDTLKIEKNGIAFMKFFAKDMIEEIKRIPGDEIKLEVVGKANLNEWNGTVTPQIFIENYEIKEDSLTDF